MGLQSMFDDRADFSGMLESDDKLCVSKVIQKAFIEVNEEGAEAAAATGKLLSLWFSITINIHIIINSINFTCIMTSFHIST